jgi:hypothetical protein
MNVHDMFNNNIYLLNMRMEEHFIYWAIFTRYMKAYMLLNLII